MDQTPDTSQTDLDAARADYGQAEDQLLTLANRIWLDGQSTVDGLLDIAEEHGATDAIMRILEAPERFGPLLAHVTDSVFADITVSVEEHLERVLDAQDRLDTATARRDAALRTKEPDRLQSVHVGGREFIIDAGKGELRSVENPTERYRLADDALARSAPAPAKPSLTEKLAKEAGIAPVKPAPPRDRTRGR